MSSSATKSLSRRLSGPRSGGQACAPSRSSHAGSGSANVARGRLWLAHPREHLRVRQAFAAAYSRIRPADAGQFERSQHGLR
ncbi:hypothetical protein, partial [Rhodanobacter lindaniclasticus]